MTLVLNDNAKFEQSFIWFLIFIATRVVEVLYLAAALSTEKLIPPTPPSTSSFSIFVSLIFIWNYDSNSFFIVVVDAWLFKVGNKDMLYKELVESNIF